MHFSYVFRFFVNPGVNKALKLQIQATLSGNSLTPVLVPSSGTFPENTWSQVVVTLASLGVALGNIDGFIVRVTRNFIF